MFHIIKLSYMAYQFIYLTKSGMTFYVKYTIYFRIIISYTYMKMVHILLDKP
jgi:hypothetical protein